MLGALNRRVNVQSSVPGGGYAAFSGSPTDLPNNTFGYGRTEATCR